MTFFDAVVKAASSSGSTSFTSPTIGTSAVRILPISAGSMSTCTTFASGAKSATLPVTRSSNRAPSAMMRSLSCRPSTAGTVPCMPGMPRCCGCESGNAPRAIRVVTTGAPVFSASFSSSFSAAPRITPPPTYRIGFFAAASISPAATICLPCAFVTGR